MALVALVARRGTWAAVALFGIAGLFARMTSPESSPILPRGTWILEGTLIEKDGERMWIELGGAAPIGRPLEPMRGRLLAFGGSATCRLGDRARMLARTRTVAPFGYPGERAEPPHSIAR